MHPKSRRTLALVLFALPLAAPAAPIAAQTPSPAAASGTIRGRVTEKTGGQPIVSAQVVAVGTRFGAITNNNGEYVIRGVPAGVVTVRAIRIGYTPANQAVTVSASDETRADFALDAAAARLEEVITTATGEQSRREFGNVVSTVKADSLVATTPTTTVNELLQGRTSGLQVIQASGQTGAASFIRIRGTSSLSLTNEPLVVIDGVRFESGSIPGNQTTQRITRLNELNPAEIESIDIIKGPSAAALYGTAAANGVLVVKTKRGQAGRPQWSFTAEGGSVSQPSNFEDNWRSWGHNLNSAGQPTGGNIQCKIANSSLKTCQIDSLTKYNPYTAFQTRPFAAMPRYMGTLQVSGGSESLRYFVSGTREQETGPYSMPIFERQRLATERGTTPPDHQVHPNQLTQSSLRGNFSLNLAKNATLDVSTGYIDRQQQNPFDGGFFAGLTFQMMTGPGFKNATNGTQREFVGDVFSVTQRATDSRFTGSTTLNYQPLDWLQLRAVTGVDQTNSYNTSINLYGEGPRIGAAWGPPAFQGGKDFDRSNNLRYSVDVFGTATRNLTERFASKTTVGLGWYKSELYQGFGEGYGFGVPGVSTPNSAAQRLASEFTTENAQYGAFLNEDLSHRDRLFVTGGLRIDRNSAFGRTVPNTVYPRASVSYVISEEGWFPHVPTLSRMRLRGAWGKAGVQPSTTAALQFLGATTYPVNGAEAPALRIASIGNPDLKPEVTTEIELGTDIGLFNDRIAVEATFFNKSSKDALYNSPLPPSYGVSIGSGAPTKWVNLAAVRNRGIELAVDATVLTAKALNWDVRLNGSHINNKLLSAGNISLPTAPGARNVVGYPLFGLWDRKITGYQDKNGDGIITENEVTLTDSAQFRGPTLPVWEAGLTNNVGLFNNRVRVMALLDYRGGFYNQWGYENQRCVSTGNCRAVNDPKAPQDRQAAAVMASSSTNKTVWGLFVPNDFIRFRELSVSYNLPERFTQRYLRNRSASIILSGRNLGVLWTRYPGLDPEANSAINVTGGGNNDFFSEPVLRYYLARVNLAF